MTTAGILHLSVVTGWRKSGCVDVAWVAMRVHVGRQRKGVVDVIDVEGKLEPPPPAPPCPESKSPAPPPKGTRMPPPPPEAPCTGTPERVAWDQPRGAVDEWV